MSVRYKPGEGAWVTAPDLTMTANHASMAYRPMVRIDLPENERLLIRRNRLVSAMLANARASARKFATVLRRKVNPQTPLHLILEDVGGKMGIGRTMQAYGVPEVLRSYATSVVLQKLGVK
jgi:hypothetical protein